MSDISRAKILEWLRNAIRTIQEAPQFGNAYTCGQINSYQVLQDKIVNRQFDAEDITPEE